MLFPIFAMEISEFSAMRKYQRMCYTSSGRIHLPKCPRNDTENVCTYFDTLLECLNSQNKKLNEWTVNKQKREWETRNYSITIRVFTILSMLFYIICIQNINHFHSKYTWFFFFIFIINLFFVSFEHTALFNLLNESRWKKAKRGNHSKIHLLMIWFWSEIEYSHVNLN